MMTKTKCVPFVCSSLRRETRSGFCHVNWRTRFIKSVLILGKLMSGTTRSKSMLTAIDRTHRLLEVSSSCPLCRKGEYLTDRVRLCYLCSRIFISCRLCGSPQHHLFRAVNWHKRNHKHSSSFDDGTRAGTRIPNRAIRTVPSVCQARTKTA